MTERRKPADALTIYLILMRSLTKLLAGHVSGIEDGACWGIWTKCIKNNAPHLISSQLLKFLSFFSLLVHGPFITSPNIG